VGGPFAGLFQLPQKALAVRRRRGLGQDFPVGGRIVLLQRRRHVRAGADGRLGAGLAGREQQHGKEGKEKKDVEQSQQLQRRQADAVGKGGGFLHGSFSRVK